jgi:hypothetical protein
MHDFIAKYKAEVAAKDKQIKDLKATKDKAV